MNAQTHWDGPNTLGWLLHVTVPDPETSHRNEWLAANALCELQDTVLGTATSENVGQQITMGSRTATGPPSLRRPNTEDFMHASKQVKTFCYIRAFCCLLVPRCEVDNPERPIPLCCCAAKKVAGSDDGCR